MTSFRKHSGETVKTLDATQQWRDLVDFSDGHPCVELVTMHSKSKRVQERRQTGTWHHAMQSQRFAGPNVIEHDDPQVPWENRDIGSGIRQQVGQQDPSVGSLRVTLEADQRAADDSEDQAWGRTIAKPFRAQLESHGWGSTGWPFWHGGSDGPTSRTPLSSPSLATAPCRQRGSHSDTVFGPRLLRHDRWVSSSGMSLPSAQRPVKSAHCQEALTR